jgi:hypothetical protein
MDAGAVRSWTRTALPLRRLEGVAISILEPVNQGYQGPGKRFDPHYLSLANHLPLFADQSVRIKTLALKEKHPSCGAKRLN